MVNNQTITMANMPQKREAGLHQMFRVFLMLGFIAMLSACGNDAGNVENAQLQDNNQKYNGPAPSTPDIQNFKREFWAKLNDVENCGGCHDIGGIGTTKFVRTDDVNQAYLEALTLVDVNDPPASAIVTKMADGHNCWLGTDQDCADTVRDYILAWQQTVSTSTQIQFVAPVIKDAGQSRNFPVTAQDNGASSFANTVYPLLSANCSECHSESSATPQSPFFASPDVNSSYQAAKSKMSIDFTTLISPPAMDADSTLLTSRLIVRLREEFHNCWTASCLADAQSMEDAIFAFATNIALSNIDPSLVVSKAMQLGDAMIASSGIRYEKDIVALYEFKQGSGNTAFDTSGVPPALPLTLNGSVSWVLGFGIEILNGGKAQGSVANSKKLSDLIKASGEYAIEAWVVPGNIVQSGSSIVTYSGGGNARNFTMGQSEYSYDFVNRTNTQGIDTLTTADEDLQATLQHVVLNFSPVVGTDATDPIVKGRSIYVNGINTGDTDIAGNEGGLLTSWNDTYVLALGNEPGGGANTLWKGKIRLLAIHSRALTQEQISQNLKVGVGQKYFMLFSIADRINVPDSYIMFEVEQFDNRAYLFNKPTFINLGTGYTVAAPIAIKGLRIGVNSRVAVSGQAFGNIDVVVDSANYVDGAGQQLSRLGTVVAVEKGPATDEFFLTFEQLGATTNAFVDPPTVPRVFPADPAQNVLSDIGVRTFDEINVTMSNITGIAKGIDLNTQELAALITKDDAFRLGNGAPNLTLREQLDKTYTFYKQQLPSVENITTYVSSHQMAIAQLAVKYCDVLVETNPSFFQDENGSLFAMNSLPGTAFANATERNKVTYPLLQKIMNVDGVTTLADQPDATQVQDLISSTATLSDADFPLLTESLMDEMLAESACFLFQGGGPLQDPISCDSVTRTKQIVKASCAALLGSSVMLVQ